MKIISQCNRIRCRGQVILNYDKDKMCLQCGHYQFSISFAEARRMLQNDQKRNRAVNISWSPRHWAQIMRRPMELHDVMDAQLTI